MLSDVITIILNVSEEALDLHSVIWEWLKSVVSWNAVFWYTLGLVTLSIIGCIRIRYRLWRMRSQIARNVAGQSADLIPAATRLFSRACRKGLITMRKHEIHNVSAILSRTIVLGSSYPNIDWKQQWSQVDTSWLEYFFTKGVMIRETLLQDTMAKALTYEGITPGRFDHRDIDILVAISVEDWKTFTAICSFACFIEGRATPIVFDLEDAIYEQAGLSDELLDGLIAAGLITQGGTGDYYTLDLPTQGARVTYFDEDEFIVRPLSEPIPREYLGTTHTRPHPLDERISVGLVDFTRAGRVLGFLTSSSEVDGFTEYLRCRWDEYLRPRSH